MKKVLFAAVIMATLATTAHAQKGSILLYGNVDLNTAKDAAGDKSTVFGITPGIGYQFSNNWTAGVNLGYGTESTTPAQGSSSPALNTFSAGPFIRYAYPLSNIFAIYAQFNADYKSSTENGEPTTSGFDATIFPAIGANLKNGFALNFSFGSLGFATSKISGESGSSNSFGLSFGSGASFGISKNFGGK